MTVSLLRHWTTSWVVLAVAMALTFAGWFLTDGLIRHRAEERFYDHGEAIRQAIQKRMAEHQLILQGGVGLFAASDAVDRDEWRRYVTALKLDRHYQDVKGVGFILVVQPRDKEAHIRYIRNDGWPDYTIHPDGERPLYTPVLYLEPSSGRNLRALGYDVYSETVRRTALERARDEGQVAISGRVTLVQETSQDQQPGFLMYAPVYRHGAATDNVAQRRDALLGFVYSPFRVRDLMQGILSTNHRDIGLELFDGINPDTAEMIFSVGHDHKKSLFNRRITIPLGGHHWTLLLYSGPELLSSLEQRQPILVAATGIFISLMLFTMIRSFYRQEQQAQALAANITTELQQANQSLVSATQAAESASKAKSLFLTSISHEIRTPLNVILGINEILLTTQLDDRQRRCVEISNRSGQTLLDLISSTLDMARIERESITLDDTPFLLSENLESVVQMMQVLTDSKGLLLTSHCDTALPSHVRGDRRRLRQVLINLISHAIQSTQQGGIWLEVTATSQADKVTFTVRNSGQDVTAHQLPQQDAGLGLTICRQLVTRMGGSLHADHTPGLGSVFSFTILLPAVTTTENQPETPLTGESRPVVKQLHLLLVDDADENRLVTTEMLRDTDCIITIAHNGSEAVQQFKEQQFDLVLMDMMMPVMDGITATRIIRALEQQSGQQQHTAIIMVTANALQTDLDTALTAGCDYYLTKPVRRFQLVDLISAIASPAIDQQRWQELREEVGSHFHILVERFLAQLPQRLADLSQAWQQDDFQQLHQCAHKLKGAAGNFGAVQLEQLAAQIEQIGRTADKGAQRLLLLAQLNLQSHKLRQAMRHEVTPTRPAA
ncbi:MAG: CHASE domain-containing protein [Magnetococcales bacterium]|nr:CHASE domain-containing protein [Magnetococcales bacterium]